MSSVNRPSRLAVAAALGAFLSGCAATAPKTPVFDPAGSVQAQAATFIGDNGKLKYLKGVKKVAVTGCNVLFAENSSATAGTEGGLFSTAGGVSRSEAKVSVLYSMSGLSDADMQRMTNQICADAEKRLAAAGFDVLPTAALAKNEAFQQLLTAGKASPFNYKTPTKGSKTTYKVFAPTGYTVYDPRYIGVAGGLGQAFKAAGGNSAAQLETRIMKQLDVSAVSVNLLVDFAQLQSDGAAKGFRLASKDSAEVKHGVNLGVTGQIDFKPNGEMKCWKRFGKDECMLNVVPPAFSSKQAVTTSEQFYKAVVNATTTGDKAAAAFTKGLSMLAAAGGLSGTSSVDITRYRVEVEPAQFERVSRKGIDGFMDMVFVQAKSAL